MTRPLRFALGTLLATTVAGGAAAQTVGFDDVSATTTIGTGITNGYAGFNWSNWNVTNTNWADLLPSGHYGRARSGEYVAYNTGGNMATISRETSFDFVAAWFGSGWLDPLVLTITGYRGSEAVFTEALNLGTGSSVYSNLNFTNVDRVTFVTSGGTAAVNPQYNWAHFNMEDAVFADPSATQLTATPEPASMILLATGLLSMAGVSYIRRRKAAGAKPSEA